MILVNTTKHFCEMYNVFILIFLCTSLVYTEPDVNHFVYEEGKQQHNVIIQHSTSPKYGPCWKDIALKIETGCKELTDTVQLKLAVNYLNCFLQLQNRTIYPCDDNDDVVNCTKNLNDTDRSSLTTFFTHTYSICYFLQAQSWYEETVRTMKQLSTNSQKVASRLQNLSALQDQMIMKQIRTLRKQDGILQKVSNISDTITFTAISLLKDLNASSHEHKEYTTGLYNKLSNLIWFALGEYHWIYSILGHPPFMSIIYLVTADERTRSARLWLTLILVFNFFMEMFIFRSGPAEKDYIKIGEYTTPYSLRIILAAISVGTVMKSIWTYNGISYNHQFGKLSEDIKNLTHAFHELKKKIPDQFPASSTGVIMEANVGPTSSQESSTGSALGTSGITSRRSAPTH